MSDLEKKDDAPDTAQQQTEKKNKVFEEELAKQDKNTDSLDGKAKEPAVVSKMAGKDISHLASTIPAEEQDHFKSQADTIKKDFDARTAAILEDDSKKPAEKREELVVLYKEFKEKIEELQGRIVGPEGVQKAREAEQGKQESKVAQDATEQFHKSREKARMELVLEAMNEEREHRMKSEREHLVAANKEMKQGSEGADDSLKLA